MGEGAGIVILEELNHALKRNVKIYGEIVGYGFTCDAYHLTSPAPKGEGAYRAINLALKNAFISPEDISYMNAHGTSTLYNDKSETKAIKSMIGHLLGAAGVVEAIACIKSLEENYIHGTNSTIGYAVKDEDCDLDYVANVGRKVDLNYVLTNSFGFGGHNASLIFKKW